MEKELQPKEIDEAKEMLRQALDDLMEDVPHAEDDYHRLFHYYVAQQFESIPPNSIKICHGRNEHGIDFYVADEDRFASYQCKLPDFDKMTAGQIPIFGPDSINQIAGTLMFLRDDRGTAKGNQFSQQARNKYRQIREFAEKEENRKYILEIILAIFGRLSIPANEKIEELRSFWKDKSCEIKVIDFDDIFGEISLARHTAKRPSKISLEFRANTQVHTNQWAYALIPVREIVSLFDEYKMSLFELNVRYYLKRSSVNNDIKRTLSTKKGQKYFHLLNNGVTISCTGFKPNERDSSITIFNPQIINGCQTVVSIYKAHGLIQDEFLRQHFNENAFIAVRFIVTDDHDLLGDIVTASNNQNEMSPRNLKSNSRVQRILQKKFNSLSPQWFYEKKDGEFDSLRTYRDQIFKQRNYEFAKNKFRIIDNEVVAKTWLSFIGFSKDASEKLYAFDLIDDGGKYEWLFERSPNETHWNAIALGPQVSLIEDNFNPHSPDPHQYLLSWVIYMFVKSYLYSPTWNKNICRERLEKSGKIIKDPSPEEVNKQLLEDSEYTLNLILNNMKEVIVELYSWIFIRRYGALSEETASAILGLPFISGLISEPDFKTFGMKCRDDADYRVFDNVLFSCFEFIRDSVTRWYSIHGAEYRASQRRIRHLHAESTIENMKQFMNKTNEDTKRSEYAWKPPNTEFLKSLPRIL